MSYTMPGHGDMMVGGIKSKQPPMKKKRKGKK